MYFICNGTHTSTDLRCLESALLSATVMGRYEKHVKHLWWGDRDRTNSTNQSKSALLSLLWVIRQVEGLWYPMTDLMGKCNAFWTRLDDGVNMSMEPAFCWKLSHCRHKTCTSLFYECKKVLCATVQLFILFFLLDLTLQFSFVCVTYVFRLIQYC